jgi:hemolysin D
MMRHLLTSLLARLGLGDKQGGRKLPPAVADEAIPFQVDLEELIAEPTPGILGRPFLIVAGLFISLLLIACIAKVDVVVVGIGRLTPAAQPIVLQPLERSIIQEIKVKPGDRVTRGQTLALFDPTFIAADQESLNAQSRAVLARLQRLEAEVAAFGNGSGAKGPSMSRQGASQGSEVTLEADIQRQRQAHYAARLANYESEMQSLAAALRAAEEDRTSLFQQLAVARDVEDLRRQLFEGKTGSRLQLLEARSVRLGFERDLQSATNRAAELGHRQAAKRAERQSFIEEWQRQSLEELSRTRTEAAQIDEALSKVRFSNGLIVMTAPADGVVLEVAQRSIGSVMREAEPLITLVPTGVGMVAEIDVKSSDIGYVRLNDRVALKIDAFPFQRHGLLEGRLASISQESFQQPGGADQIGAARGRGPDGLAVHRARVELMADRLQYMPDGANLTPGMTLAAEIKVGERRAISFFLGPIQRGLSESMREP